MSRPIRIRLALSCIVLVTCIFLAFETRAESDHHAVVRDWRGYPVLTQLSGTCVRTKWMESHDVCHPDIAETVVQHTQRRQLSQEERTVYFPFNIASLTPDARGRLDTLATNIKSQDDVKGARVVGFADRIGTASYNEALSKKRAENVKSYLVSKGIVNARVAETRWFGSTMPSAQCSNALPRPELIACLQKDRRVEVEIDYLPDVFAANQ